MNEICNSIKIDSSDRKSTKNELKKLIYNELKKLSGRELPWGTLSGRRKSDRTHKRIEKQNK